MQVWSLSPEDPLEKETATHSSIIAWKTPRTEEPGGPQSMRSQRAGHNWVTGPSTAHPLTAPRHERACIITLGLGHSGSSMCNGFVIPFAGRVQTDIMSHLLFAEWCPYIIPFNLHRNPRKLVQSYHHFAEKKIEAQRSFPKFTQLMRHGLNTGGHNGKPPYKSQSSRIP